MNKKDMFIKEKLKQDKVISDRADQIFENLKEEFMKDNNKDNKLITISFKRFLSLAASFVIVLFLGTNLYAHTLGKPNIFTAIKNLFNIDTEDYNAAEEDINVTVESNGVKLTLKTAAMDDNVLIVKYLAEGEKLAEEFYTYQDFEKEMIEYVKMSLTLSGWNLQEDIYKEINEIDAMNYLYSIRDKLYEIGLNQEETKELLYSTIDNYIEYVALQNGIANDVEGNIFTMQSAKEKIEQTIAMFESKVTSKYKIITSEDNLSEYNIDAIAQSIEKEENKYIIHAIYNVDTLVDILDKFALDININKIGRIEGDWNYSIELNKAKLNKRVETIEFYNKYEVSIDSENVEQLEGSNLKVELKQLAISDFSSVLNIKTIKEDYYNKIDYTSLENNIFPVTFVVLDETGKVIGTSCQTREDAINANPIVDRIILKGVDYNTKKIIVKMYSNNGNKLIETLEVDLKEAKKLMDTRLEDEFTADGIRFNYPKDWTFVNAVHPYHWVHQSPENLDGNRAYLEICIYKDDKVLTFDGIMENRTCEIVEGLKIIENGKVFVGETNEEAEYAIYNKDNEKIKTITIIKYNRAYNIIFRGNEKLYDKYNSIFEEVLKTVKFYEVEHWEQQEEKPSNEVEENTNENSTVLYGDVNCDGSVDDMDEIYLTRHLAEWEGYELTEEGKSNADVDQDGKVTAKDGIILTKHLANWEGYEKLPHISKTEEEIYDKVVTNLSWTEYTAPGIKFKYPSDLSVEEVGGYYRGSNPGKISTIIKGVAKDINSNTQKLEDTKMEISIYEPLYLRDFDEGVTIDTNSSVITNVDGMEWRLYSEFSDDGNIIYTYTSYSIYNNGDKSSAWEHKIVFNVVPNGSNYLMFNIMNSLIGSTDIISY